MRTMSFAFLVLLLVLAIGLSVVDADLGFYAPERGDVAKGRATAEAGALHRGIALLGIEEPLPGEKTLPSFSEVVTFFGLEDETLRCSLNATYGGLGTDDFNATIASQPLAVGDELKLCLN